MFRSLGVTFAVVVFAAAVLSSSGNNGSQVVRDKTRHRTLAMKSYSVPEVTPRRATLNSDFPATIQGRQNVEIRPKIDGYIEDLLLSKC